ncbi:TPR domain protein [Lindgomyces ingoldianus]|uniref:TPR domain protein n=1 Tax=Lindgomyces ingoldianus TaxID=673940 RepID=A0ACB6RCA8_9PLEO|nr:TPR domain protein [Lindgomyces ingoldianus]KAF2475957.1 TPR domain protein [Lindgomyces ingoldianus]
MVDHAPILTTGAKAFTAISDNRGVVLGDASGHAHIVARPETPPNPSCTIPFRRDPDFVNRGTLLDQIRERCSAPASRIALVGLGGVGKSQLAIEHCYRTVVASPDTWVFWVHASNTARVEQSFRDIADRVKLAGRNDPQADLFKLVHNWLRNERNRKWLLVLDNADGAAALSRPLNRDQSAQPTKDSAPQWHLSKYLPPSSYGSVLVTSRTKSVALQLVESCDIIPVEPMHDASAQELLHRKLGGEIEKDGIAELAAALEFMPLALVQAAAYIHQRAPRCSVRQYLDEFRRSDTRKTALLDQEAGHLRRDEEAKNSIIVTWQISFNHIRSTRQSAADLLSLMSFFNRQGIHKALLCHQDNIGNKCDDGDNNNNNNNNIEGNDPDDNAQEVKDRLEDDILTLRDYSFISITRDTDTFDMHRLVQLATQKWLEGQGKAERWKAAFITNLCRAFPIGEYENWERCRELFPHAKLAVMQQPESEGARKEWAKLLYKAAWYAWRQGRGNEAEEMSGLSVAVRTKLLGKEHEETLSSMAMVGLARKLKGRWKEAEQLEVQVMKARARTLGERHPSTVTSMANLASTYWNQGRWKEAEQLEVQVIETRKKELGEKHPDTLTSMTNLASTYRNQGRWKEAEQLGVQVGRWKEAEQLGVQVVETRKKELGEKHPDTLTGMANLASTYRNQGRWKEAERLEVQVVETRKKELGEKHPDTLTSMANLASTYSNQGRWKEAEQLEVQVMDASAKELGEKHPSTLTSMANLASTYSNQGRWREAEQLEVQVLEASAKELGEKHPDTLTSMANLATTYRNQGRWKEAEKLGVQVMETRKKELGEKHPSTLTSMASLASTYRNQGRWKEAEQLGVRVVETRKKELGEKHPDTLTGMANLASTYWNQGRWKEAEQLEVQVMEANAKELGERHPDTLTSMANLAFTKKSQGRDINAAKLMEDCCRLQREVLGSKHPNTLSSIETLRKWRQEKESAVTGTGSFRSWRNAFQRLRK